MNLVKFLDCAKRMNWPNPADFDFSDDSISDKALSTIVTVIIEKRYPQELKLYQAPKVAKAIFEIFKQHLINESLSIDAVDDYFWSYIALFPYTGSTLDADTTYYEELTHLYGQHYTRAVEQLLSYNDTISAHVNQATKLIQQLHQHLLVHNEAMCENALNRLTTYFAHSLVQLMAHVNALIEHLTEDAAAQKYSLNKLCIVCMNMLNTISPMYVSDAKLEEAKLRLMAHQKAAHPELESVKGAYQTLMDDINRLQQQYFPQNLSQRRHWRPLELSLTTNEGIIIKTQLLSFKKAYEQLHSLLQPNDENDELAQYKQSIKDIIQPLALDTFKSGTLDEKSYKKHKKKICAVLDKLEHRSKQQKSLRPAARKIIYYASNFLLTLSLLAVIPAVLEAIYYKKKGHVFLFFRQAHSTQKYPLFTQKVESALCDYYNEIETLPKKCS